jgi:hypothetical protein
MPYGKLPFGGHFVYLLSTYWALEWSYIVMHAVVRVQVTRAFEALVAARAL